MHRLTNLIAKARKFVAPLTVLGIGAVVFAVPHLAHAGFLDIAADIFSGVLGPIAVGS